MKEIKEWDMKIEFTSKSENEGFARSVAALYAAKLNPTVDEIDDIKTAVSEAVTNCIIHAYRNSAGIIRMKCVIHNGNEFYVEIEDSGCGIENISMAMEPLYTSAPELERSGMGFAFMEAFMDELSVWSEAGVGTKITMKKCIGEEKWKY